MCLLRFHASMSDERCILAYSCLITQARKQQTFKKAQTIPVTAVSVFLRSQTALLPPLTTSKGDWMPRKSTASSLRNWIHVKRISLPWFSSHS